MIFIVRYNKLDKFSFGFPCDKVGFMWSMEILSYKEIVWVTYFEKFQFSNIS